MKDDTTVIAITSQRPAVEQLLAGSGVTAKWYADPNKAMAAAMLGPAQVAIIDCDFPGRLATLLARAFLFERPQGRVVLLSSGGSSETANGLVTRDPRIEILYAPWNRLAILDIIAAVTPAPIG